jgi:hypothetical protein
MTTVSMPREATAQDALSTAIRHALPLDDNALANVHEAVRDYVASARLRGDRPEVVLVALKSCAHEALSFAEPIGDRAACASLVNLVVKLAIKEYYAERDAD